MDIDIQKNKKKNRPFIVRSATFIGYWVTASI
jgi:hypothetical protein